MFILFTFIAFFFSKIMSRKRVHPIQCLLIGVPLVVFYTLLISLVTLYAASVLKHRMLV